MVINSEFFEKGENFVQPAEISSPFWLKTACFGAFGARNRRFYASESAFIFIFRYEYAKTRKLPFDFGAEMALRMSGDASFCEGEQQKTADHKDRRLGAIYYIMVYIRRSRPPPRRPNRRRGAGNDARQKPSRWHPTWCISGCRAYGTCPARS